jgi:hypothetical protein
MMRRISVCVAAVCLVLAAQPALGDWLSWVCTTSTVEQEGVDGRFYMNDGATLVQTGALVQFIVGLNGSEIVDPLEYFDYNHSGAVEFNTSEYADAVAWLNAGADPAEISGGLNVLTTGSAWDGTATLTAPGYFLVDPIAQTGNPYEIVPGDTFDLIAYRAWSLRPDEMAALLAGGSEEIWYLTGRELGSHDNRGGGPDTGWWIGMPGIEGGGAPYPEDWVGFTGLIGFEVYLGLRDKYALDSCLGTIPEPGLLAVVGVGVAMGLLRRRRENA